MWQVQTELTELMNRINHMRRNRKWNLSGTRVGSGTAGTEASSVPVPCEFRYEFRCMLLKIIISSVSSALYTTTHHKHMEPSNPLMHGEWLALVHNAPSSIRHLIVKLAVHHGHMPTPAPTCARCREPLPTAPVQLPLVDGER